MAWTHKAKHSPGHLSHRLLSYLSAEWIPILLDLFHNLRQFVRRERHEGMYDILAYDATLELMDPEGGTAVFNRRQKVKFLQDNVIAFQDYAWGDGEIFADTGAHPAWWLTATRRGISGTCSSHCARRKAPAIGCVIDRRAGIQEDSDHRWILGLSAGSPSA